jgi:hypothetical protein
MAQVGCKRKSPVAVGAALDRVDTDRDRDDKKPRLDYDDLYRLAIANPAEAAPRLFRYPHFPWVDGKDTFKSRYDISVLLLWNRATGLRKYEINKLLCHYSTMSAPLAGLVMDYAGGACVLYQSTGVAGLQASLAESGTLIYTTLFISHMRARNEWDPNDVFVTGNDIADAILDGHWDAARMTNLAYGMSAVLRKLDGAAITGDELAQHISIEFRDRLDELLALCCKHGYVEACEFAYV